MAATWGAELARGEGRGREGEEHVVEVPDHGSIRQRGDGALEQIRRLLVGFLVQRAELPGYSGLLLAKHRIERIGEGEGQVDLVEVLTNGEVYYEAELEAWDGAAMTLATSTSKWKGSSSFVTMSMSAWVNSR